MEVSSIVTFALFTDPAGNRLGLAEFGSSATGTWRSGRAEVLDDG
jgi:hypothetical protein